jgi:hypothetical protein
MEGTSDRNRPAGGVERRQFQGVMLLLAHWDRIIDIDASMALDATATAGLTVTDRIDLSSLPQADQWERPRTPTTCGLMEESAAGTVVVPRIARRARRHPFAMAGVFAVTPGVRCVGPGWGS